MKKTIFLTALLGLFCVSTVFADLGENAVDIKSMSSGLPTLERANPSPSPELAFDLGLTNIGEEKLVWEQCPDESTYFQFWVKAENFGDEVCGWAIMIFTLNGVEIGHERVPDLYPGEVIKLVSPEFHVEWPKCEPFLIGAHIWWLRDQNPDNDRIEHIKYVSGHVDECLRYDDGRVYDGWTWIPGCEYPDWAMASKWHFDQDWTVVYVEFWLSQSGSYPRGHVEFFVWREDPNRPGYPLDNTPDDIVYRNEYQLVPDHIWPDQQMVCFPLCLDVVEGETYFFGYCNRQGTMQFLSVDAVEDYPDRNMYKEAGVWYKGPSFGDWFVHPCVQEPTGRVTQDCEMLTPIFCRGKNIYFLHTITNSTAGHVTGVMTFTGYAGFDCDPPNALIAIARNKTYPVGVTTEYYFFKVPGAVGPGQYSVSIGGTLGDYDLFCCMNLDIVQCEPWKTGDNTDWELVEIDRPDIALPTVTELYRNYPNPFNAQTVIEYQLPVSSTVKVEVYNLLGSRVATLIDAHQEAGYKSVTWDASEISSGIYFYKLSAGDYTETRRMMLVK